MNVMSDVTVTKRLSQTRISSYFKGCIRSMPSDKISPATRKTRGTRRKLSFSSPASLEVAQPTQKTSMSLTPLSPHLSLIAGIPKRKLPAPIFSDDEDSENDGRVSNSAKKRHEGNKQPEVLMSLNKPAPLASPQKTYVKWTPQVASTSSPLSSNSSREETPSCSKTIQVLQDVVIHSPKKSPKDNVKDEKKKVNYEYLKVFREFFINVIKNNYLASLLSDKDKDLLHTFFNMEKNYQYVCVKLFLWKPMWYNVFKYVGKINLSMSDNEVIAMYNYLKEHDFVHTEYMTEDLFTLLELLSLKDVREIARSFRLPNVSGTKDTVVAKLLKNCKTQVTLTSVMNTEEVLRKRIKEKMGFCIKLSTTLSRCLYSVYVLNTFTNSTLLEPQDYFKSVNYFKIVFPSYNIEKFHIFYTPQEFSSFTEALKLRNELEKALERKNITHIFEICKCAFAMLKQLNDKSGNSFDSSREPHLERFTPHYQYTRILSGGLRPIISTYFKDVMVWLEYLISQGFCKFKRGEWYINLALIYTQYIKHYEKAAKLVIKAFKEEKEHFTDVQLQELVHRGKMLDKKCYNLSTLFHDEIVSLAPPSCDRSWPQDVLERKSTTSDERGRKRMYAHQCENGDVTYLTVEQTALQYYKDTDFPSGEHCEGSLIIASFCLLFWDIIYETYVKGTFVSSVQNAPLDMYTKYFYINREDVIKKRLQRIGHSWNEEAFRKKFIHNWNLHSHESSLCAIDSIVENPEYLLNVISCIGRPILAKIFERVVKNYKAHHSGFPDLIVWNLEEKRAKFVEVKSENDKLSTKQKLWLNYLIDIGASVAVCRVEPKASRKKLIKSKAKKTKA